MHANVTSYKGADIVVICLYFITIVRAGIFGMDFYVVLGRPGMRVSRRKHTTARVGSGHKVTKEDAQKWFVSKYEGLLQN